jgi:hypothetical protein
MWITRREDPDQGYVIKFLFFRFLVNRKLKVNSIPIEGRYGRRGEKLTELGFTCDGFKGY